MNKKLHFSNLPIQSVGRNREQFTFSAIGIAKIALSADNQGGPQQPPKDVMCEIMCDERYATCKTLPRNKGWVGQLGCLLDSVFCKKYECRGYNIGGGDIYTT